MKRKHIVFAILGIIIGIITGYLRAFSPVSFWTLSDIAEKFGFWILTVSLIAYYSKNEKSALLNSFIYMIMMCLSYYGYLYIDSGIFYKKQLILWGIFSIISSIFANLIYKANNEKIRYGMLINYIPLTILGIEFADLLYLFLNYKTNFMQLLIDFVGIIILFLLFSKNKEKAYKKKLFLVSFISVIIICFIFLILWNI